MIDIGAKGLIVRDIQTFLKNYLELFEKTDPATFKKVQSEFKITQNSIVVDGDFGKRTGSFVKLWKYLSDHESLSTMVDNNDLNVMGVRHDLFYRMLSLTATWEGTWWTGSHGEYDAGIITHGILGFTWSGGVLPVYLKNFIQKGDPKNIKGLIGVNIYNQFYDLLYNKTLAESSKELSKIIPDTYRLIDPWNSALEKISSLPESRNIQIETAKNEYLSIAINLANRFKVKTVRGLMMLFDIQVQLGTAKLITYLRDNPYKDEEELIKKLYDYSLWRSAAKWKKHVSARKGVILNNTGDYTGIRYSLPALGLIGNWEGFDA